METLRVYLDNMFKALPDNQRVRDAKAELFSMMEDKYHLLKEEGKTENEAVGIVINEFGNLDEVAETLGISQDVGNKQDILELSHDEVVKAVEVHKEAGPKIAFGVFIIVLGVAFMMLLMGLQAIEVFPISENGASYLGVAALIIIVAIAVYYFINYGSKLEKYEKFEKEIVQISYEDKTYLEDIKEDINISKRVASSVILFVISPVPILLANFIFEEMEGYVLLGVALTLLLIAIGVNNIIKYSIVDGICDKLLQIGEYTETRKKTLKKYDHIFGAYWIAVFIIYMIWSFTTNAWHKTWLIWPIAGALFGIITILLSKER